MEQQSNRGKVDILLVDDKKENILVMESVLTDKNLNLVKALSGEEALKLCLTHSFAVILMDVNMPGMDGFETAKLLRSIKKTKHIPIIFVTAMNKEQESIFKGYEVGAVDYLFKPFNPIILKSKVNIFKDMYLQRQLIEEQARELTSKMRELKRMQEQKDKLECMSMEDALTQTYNRRGFDRLLNVHWKNCLRYHLPLSIIYVDLDHFKNYNDHYGHCRGDEVLADVSDVLRSSLMRAEDFVCRYGGEEFIIVLPNTSLDGAISVAERINKKLLNRNIKHDYNENFGRVTVSMGIAMKKPSYYMLQTEIINEADALLYTAKKTGRNRYEYKNKGTKKFERPNLYVK